MVDITNKYNTLREAKAQSIITFGNRKVIELIKENKIPKGDVLEMSKTAGLFAVKNTSNSIPDCHPIPIESTSISFELKDSSIEVLVNVKTIYKTGVEVEAMHAASIVALTIYDMIKPIDKKIILDSVKKTRAIVSAEEHNYHGGLGETVSRLLSQNYPIPQEFVATKDTFGESGKPAELMVKYQLSKEAIIDSCKKVIKRK